ncbi:MAG: response regulator [Methanogenium sp.]|nr:response regulator [Methanogenium sp.]
MIRILMVDSVPSLLEVGKIFLEREEGFIVDTSSSVIDALESLQKEDYDIIVFDFYMPEMSGMDLLVKIRTIHQNLPIIIFTGMDREETAHEALNRGADFYVERCGSPRYIFADLAHKIKRAVRIYRAEKALVKSEKRFLELVNLLPLPVFETDRSGEFTFANKSAHKIFGYPESDLITGKNIMEMVIPEERGIVATHFDMCLNGKALNISEYTAQRENGSTFPIIIHSGPMSENDYIYGIRGAVVDITKSKE